MKVRKLDKNGEVVFGRGEDSYHVNTAEGVAQNVMTSLALWKGSWFFDEDEGTPWIKEALGHHSLIDTMLRSRILETPEVLSIVEMEMVLNPDNREVSVSVTIETPYGQAQLESKL